jgi:hypothetical protein
MRILSFEVSATLRMSRLPVRADKSKAAARGLAPVGTTNHGS